LIIDKTNQTDRKETNENLESKDMALIPCLILWSSLIMIGRPETLRMS